MSIVLSVSISVYRFAHTTHIFTKATGNYTSYYIYIQKQNSTNRRENKIYLDPCRSNDNKRNNICLMVTLDTKDLFLTIVFFLGPKFAHHTEILNRKA